MYRLRPFFMVGEVRNLASDGVGFAGNRAIVYRFLGFTISLITAP